MRLWLLALLAALPLIALGTSHASVNLNMNVIPFYGGPCTALTPSDIQSAYGFNQLYSAGINGTGERVAVIVMQGDPRLFSDTATFDSQYNLPPLVNGSNLIVEAPFGGTNTFALNNNWSAETALDVEVIHSLAPGATIYVVVSPDDAHLFDAINYATTNLSVNSISISWGSSEQDYNTQSIDQEDAVLSSAAQDRIAVFAASGDYGAYNNLNSLNVNFPASSPYVIAVGGTSISVGYGGVYDGETGWSGSGGGYSTFFSKPLAQPNSSLSRMVPDVAFNAGTPICAFVDSSWGGYYGTSVAAPSWTALDTLVNQKASGSGALSLNSLYSAYYSEGSTVFNSISSGNNGYYSVKSGYNLVTGLGSPKAYQLVQVLSKQSYRINLSSSPVDAVFNVNGVNYTGPISLNFSYGEEVTLRAYPAVQSDTLRYAFEGYSGYVNSSSQTINFAVTSSGKIDVTFNPQFLVFERGVGGKQNYSTFVDNRSVFSVSSPLNAYSGHVSYSLIGFRIDDGPVIHNSSLPVNITSATNITFEWNAGTLSDFTFNGVPSGALLLVSYPDYEPLSNTVSVVTKEISNGGNISTLSTGVINYSSVPFYYNIYRYVAAPSSALASDVINVNFIQESKYPLNILSDQNVRILPTAVMVQSSKITETFKNSTVWAPTGEDFSIQQIVFNNNGLNLLASPIMASPSNYSKNISLPVSNVTVSVGMYLGIPIVAASVDFAYKNVSLTTSTSLGGTVFFRNVPDSGYNISISAYGTNYNYPNLNGAQQNLQITPMIYQLYLIIGSISIVILAFVLFEIWHRKRSRRLRTR